MGVYLLFIRLGIGKIVGGDAAYFLVIDEEEPIIAFVSSVPYVSNAKYLAHQKIPFIRYSKSYIFCNMLQ